MTADAKKDSQNSRRRRYAINTAVVIISTVLTLLLAETGVRLILPQKLITQYSKIWRPDSVFGWRHQENVATLVNSGEGAVHFVTDNEGYRINADGEITRKADVEQDYAVLFIGDSFLEAIQVENRLTIPQVMREALASQYPDANISVTNSSVGGWNPNHYYLEAQRLSPERYDLAIVFLYVANDVICEKVQRFPPKQVHVHKLRFPKQVSSKEFISAILYPINETFERYSHLYVLTKNRTKWLRVKAGLAPVYFPDIFLTTMRSSACWETTIEVCESIRDEFARHGTTCIFALLPTHYQIDEHVFNSYVKSLNIDEALVDLEQPNNKLRNLFDSSSLVLVDPLEHMRATADKGATLYGSIDSHLNAKGHRVVADYMVPIVKSEIE